MNKTELISRVAEKSEISKKDAGVAVAAVIEAIEEALIEGEKVQLTGFGTFEVRDRKARDGRNPQNPGEVIHIPAYKAPVFRAGKKLKESVN